MCRDLCWGHSNYLQQSNNSNSETERKVFNIRSRDGAMFSVRIVKVDHYLTPPKKGLDECYSDLRGCQLSRVPVVRIFGSTPAGQKACVHLHGVYPYVVVPYDGTLPTERYLYQLAVSLERALATTGHQPRAVDDAGTAGVQHVHKVELVFGTPFYGYHKNEQQFLKIYFLNPQFMDRAVELLQSGAVLNRLFQPHEAHIPFILQMFIDYNLHGMNLIKFRKVTFRENKMRSSVGSGNCSQSSMSSFLLLDSGPSSSSNLSGQIWDPGTLPSHMITEDNVLKASSCELEVDAQAADILNSLEVLGMQMNPGIAAIWEDERQRRLDSIDAPNLTPPLSQDRPLAPVTKSELFYLEKMKNKLDSHLRSAESRLLTSQAHENSGIEIQGSQLATEPTVVKPFTEVASTSLSQVSLNADDHEVVNLMLNMADFQSDGDEPPSPEDNEIDENDNRTMSQVVWEVDSDLERVSPNEDSDNDSGFLRSPEDHFILQLDGANDELDRPKSRKANERSDISTRLSSNSTKSPDVQPTSRSPNLSKRGTRSGRTPDKTDPDVVDRDMIALRQCHVVLSRLRFPAAAKEKSCQSPQETVKSKEMPVASAEVKRRCGRSRKQLESTETESFGPLLADAECQPPKNGCWNRISVDLAAILRSKIEEAETRRLHNVSSSSALPNSTVLRSAICNTLDAAPCCSSIESVEVESAVNTKADEGHTVSACSESRDAIPADVLASTEPSDPMISNDKSPDAFPEDVPVSVESNIQNPNINGDTTEMPNSPILFSEANSPTVSLVDTVGVISSPETNKSAQMPNSPVRLSSGSNSPTISLDDSVMWSTSSPERETNYSTVPDDVEVDISALSGDCETIAEMVTPLDVEHSVAAENDAPKINEDVSEVNACNEVKCTNDETSELAASPKNDGTVGTIDCDKARAGLLALRNYRLKRFSPLLEVTEGRQAVATQTETSSAAVSMVADSACKDRKFTLKGQTVKLDWNVSHEALSQMGRERIVVKQLGTGRRKTGHIGNQVISETTSTDVVPVEDSSSIPSISVQSVPAVEQCEPDVPSVIPCKTTTTRSQDVDSGGVASADVVSSQDSSSAHAKNDNSAEADRCEPEVHSVNTCKRSTVDNRKSKVMYRSASASPRHGGVGDGNPKDLLSEPEHAIAEDKTKKAKFRSAASSASPRSCKNRLAQREPRARDAKQSLQNLPEIGESDVAPEAESGSSSQAKAAEESLKSTLPVVRLERLNENIIEKYSRLKRETPEVTLNDRRRKLRKLLLYQVYNGNLNTPSWSCRKVRRKSKKSHRLAEYPLIHSAPPPETHPIWSDNSFVVCHSEPHSSVIGDTQFSTINKEFLYSSSVDIQHSHPSTSQEPSFSACLASPSEVCGDELWSPASTGFNESNFQTVNEPDVPDDGDGDDLDRSIVIPNCANDDGEDVMWKLSYMSPKPESRNSGRISSLPNCSSPTAEEVEPCKITPPIPVPVRRPSEENPDFLFYGGAHEDEATWRRVLGLPHKNENAMQIETASTTRICVNDEENKIDTLRTGIDPEPELVSYAPSGKVLHDVALYSDVTSIDSSSCSTPCAEANCVSVDGVGPMPRQDCDCLETVFQKTPTEMYCMSQVNPFDVSGSNPCSQPCFDHDGSAGSGQCSWFCSTEENLSSTSPDIFSPPASVSQLPTSFEMPFNEMASQNYDVECSVIPPSMNCQLSKPPTCQLLKHTKAHMGTFPVTANPQISHETPETFNLEFASAADLLVDKLMVPEDDVQVLDSADVEMSLEELKSTLDLVASSSDVYNVDCLLGHISNTQEKIAVDDYRQQKTLSSASGTTTFNSNTGGTPIQSFYTYGSSSDPSERRSASFSQCGQSQHPSQNAANVDSTPKFRVFTYGIEAPDPATIQETFSKYGIPEVYHEPVFCSDPRDVPDRPMEFGDGALVVKLRSNAVHEIPEFAGILAETGLEHWHQVYLIAQESGYVFGNGGTVNMKVKPHRFDRRNFWEPLRLPPIPSDVRLWLKSQRKAKAREKAIAAEKRRNKQGAIVKPATVIGDKRQTPLDGKFMGDVSPILPLEQNSASNNVTSSAAAILYHSTPGDSTNRRHKRSLIHAFDQSAKTADVTATNDFVSSSSSSPRPMNVASPASSSLLRLMDVTSSTPSSLPRPMDVTSSAPSVAAASGGIVSKRKKRAGRKLSYSSETPPISLRKITLLLQNTKILSPIAEKPQTSQLEGPTPKNTCGFKISVDSLQETKSVHHYQCVTMMSLELHVETVDDLRPDPTKNNIRAIFYHVHHDISEKSADKNQRRARETGIVFVASQATTKGDVVGRSELLADLTTSITVRDELELMHELANIVRNHDPDFLVGYEVQMLSWGFLMERALVLGVKLWSTLSRVPDDPQNSFRPVQKSGDGFYVNIVGRTVFSLWQLMRQELPLQNYTFENVAYHVLHLRIPLYTYRTLSQWFDDGQSAQRLNRWRTIQHYIVRAEGNVKIMDQLNLVGRTGELARLFGIQFWEVHSRGTQFRVESMMLRLCRQAKYVAVSPSVQQRSTMRAPEHVPLIMEPLSQFYTHPVVVLDFQSLYPSIIIAYNYCFSTCLGRIENVAEPNAVHFGCTSLKVPAGLMLGLRDRYFVSPCGVAFVKPEIRKGVLPRMLEEILTTRVMVKMTMKRNKHDRALTRILDARQLGLKLIANVTYGYTSANFSGRMPCVEIADSVVSKARETLERAVHLIEGTSKWGAKVVYGDTDSMFVLLEGRSKERAFEIGQEIVNAVTAANPKPIKLKLEKVYLPCVLQSKKRYVGFMYETPEQKEPVYDAKGIETVRRDGCPAVAKILEKTLRTLFKTHDVSQVRTYVVHQFQKLMSGRASMQDYVFTREYRGRYGYARPDTPAPALKLAKQFLRRDPRTEPRLQERVPYVIVYGSPGSLLIDLVRHPDDVLQDSSLRLNAKYYINNIVIPPLDRVLSLVGANVRHWSAFMPRNTRLPMPAVESGRRQETLSRFLVSSDCPICDKPMTKSICDACSANPQMAAVVLSDRVREWERRHDHLSKICHNCVGTVDFRMDCVTLDCPIRFRLVQAARDLGQGPYLRSLLKSDPQLQW